MGAIAGRHKHKKLFHSNDKGNFTVSSQGKEGWEGKEPTQAMNTKYDTFESLCM